MKSPTRRALKNRLTVRLAVGLCLGAAVILVAAGVWNISLQRRHMTRLVSTSADGTADTIRRSTRDAMMRNNPDEVHRIIEAIGAQPGMERIRIFDKQGRIRFSTRAEETGQLVDKQAEQCYVCHRADRPLERLERTNRVRTYERNGERILGIIAPIRNDPDCASAACHAHPAEQQVLGVLDVQLSLSPVDEQLAASEVQMGIGLAVTAVAILLLAGFLTWRLVLRPVQRLTRATVQVGQGELLAQVPVTSSDEIGAMAQSWNDMIEELGRTRRELQEWNRGLEERVADKTRELRAAHKRMLVVEKMASLGKLAAVVAHEINNPLAGIATYARLLHRQVEENGRAFPQKDDFRKALEMVEREAVRCGQIVKNLLLFSRTPGARFERSALGPLFERCIMLVRHKADLSGITLKQDMAADLPDVVCDPSQVQQLILALAMNAIEALADGGELTLGARTDGKEHVILTVADNGPGIPAEALPRIFEPFYTTKQEGQGVGLGLAVVYGIVNRHDGQIEVDSSPGTGTCFTVRLPVTQRAPAVPEGVNP